MFGSNFRRSNLDHYRSQQSCGQGNIFTPVCHSVHRGVCLSACWDTPLPDPPGAEPPWPRHPPTRPLSGADPCPRTRHPPGSRPPGADTHPPGSRLQYTVYERPVRILLECVLVYLSLLLCFQ